MRRSGAKTGSVAEQRRRDGAPGEAPADEIRRLRRELTEAQEHQAAAAEVLGIISRSPADARPVFEAIVQSAARLCGATFSVVQLLDGQALRPAATNNYSAKALALTRQHQGRPDRSHLIGRAIMERAVVHVPDVLADPDYSRELALAGGWRAVLAVPMLRDGEPVGAIAVARSEPVPFPEHQVRLLSMFADQAVIAIENARLFEELKARTDELGKALEQQVATGEILRVIASSPTDIAPVLDAVAESAARLCGAVDAQIFRAEGDVLRLAASFGSIPIHFRERVIARDWVTGRAVVDRLTVHVPDLAAESESEYPVGLEMQRQHGHRTTLATPLLRQDKALGAILIRRTAVDPFTEDQIRLLEAFADQAVIAIENVRLFDEVRARTHDLTVALEQQTATSAILRAISTSPTDVQPVFETIVRNAVALCGSLFANVFRFDGELLHLVASHKVGPDFMELLWAKYPMRPDSSQVSGRAVLTRSVVRLEDTVADPDYDRRFSATLSWRRMLGVPMLRQGEPLGVIVVGWVEAGPVPKAQEELLKQFADQAVIAIENARLLKELRDSLQQQTATADVLKAISRATFNLPTVLQTLVEAAARLCEADQGTIAREQNGVFRRVANHGFSERFKEVITTTPVLPERGSATGRALAEGRLVHIPDVQADPEYTFAEAKELGGFRTILAVPMLREGVGIGVLALTRRKVQPFKEKQIGLVATFADQAAIAIENVRLFESAEARTRELAQSLEDLRTAQDRLVQTEKLASLGQLTAGIAHEIKNPLNFVNNFAAVSTELIGELQEALAGAHLGSDAREEIAELSQMLRGNLDKIVQHGRRADSIVRNMLLHARQGSGEHRQVDINAIVEESLNLAYYGARAERPGFNITLERAFDPAAGQVDVFPQEITRVLLNLISNGFYAALKKAESDGQDYAPTLKAATRNLGDRVEITIRDNGTGIPPEVKEQLFRPFFTTKPVGEGTGLGLSISHDIIVKQHGGQVEVETRPGEFTEFRIVLPRTAAGLAAGAPA
jgi:GAF domain-containing protein